MKLYIKYMEGLLLKERVKEELTKLHIPFEAIDTGVVTLPTDVTREQRKHLKANLLPFGLKLHEKKKGMLVEKIKATIREMVSYADGHPVMSYSLYLSAKLHFDYTYLANIFSEVHGITIQQYIILSKIERVKKMFLDNDISLSEISFQLHYSSVAHLSGQFKKTTGLSPSCYKRISQQQALAKNTNE